MVSCDLRKYLSAFTAMSEVAESQTAKREALAMKPPTGSDGHPAREWIDTLLQAAVIAKGKQKKLGQDDVAMPAMVTSTSTDTSTATTIAASTTSSFVIETTKLEAETTSGLTEEFKEKNESATSADARDTSVMPNADVVKAKEVASTPSLKRYRRRQCEVEGCTKFARFNNACSGHGGRRLCAENGCERVAQFGHKCSAHGGVKLCRAEGCHRAVQSRGCCKTHGGGVRCQYQGCTKGAISKGFCRSHGGGSRCAESGCQKWAQRLGYCVRHSKSAADSKNLPIPEPITDSLTTFQDIVPQSSSASI